MTHHLQKSIAPVVTKDFFPKFFFHMGGKHPDNQIMEGKGLILELEIKNIRKNTINIVIFPFFLFFHLKIIHGGSRPMIRIAAAGFLRLILGQINHLSEPWT